MKRLWMNPPRKESTTYETLLNLKSVFEKEGDSVPIRLFLAPLLPFISRMDEEGLYVVLDEQYEGSDELFIQKVETVQNTKFEEQQKEYQEYLIERAELELQQATEKLERMKGSK
jgi:hypothetical protein